MDKQEQFKQLHKKFIDGTRWLNRQMSKRMNVDKDKQDFIRLVADPLDAMWDTFINEEKDYFLETYDKAINQKIYRRLLPQSKNQA